MTKKELLAKAQGVLNKVEYNLFTMMYPQSGVVFVKGRPGTAKSAIGRSIASKLGMEFIDCRLPTMDEIDLGTYPVVTLIDGRPVLDHAIPRWAQRTAENPDKFYIIDFEELNRADTPQRNASLGILNERIIGTDFVFGPNVFMMATGNEGAEDSTDVHEFDNALKSRLITMKWDLGVSDWLDIWARVNLHPDVVRFIEQHPSSAYPSLKDQGNDKDVITNYRTWTFLSDALVELFGRDATVDDYESWLIANGPRYIGVQAQKFVHFLIETKRLKLLDVLSGKVKNFERVQRENRAELLEEIIVTKIEDYKPTHLKRVIDFMESFKGTDSDLITGKLYQWLNKSYDDDTKKVQENPNVKAVMGAFKEEIAAIRKTLASKKK